MSEGAHDFKRRAAERALALIEPGMAIGLGTGSTANAFIGLLGERMRAEPLRLTCVATSLQTERAARAAGIEVADFGALAEIDLTVDGADEIGPNLDLIKGGGGALLREKIVAMASARLCIVADASKLVPRLGAFPLPVEIVDFGLSATLAMIEVAAEEAGCSGPIAIRRTAAGEPFRTDSGHLIADCRFGAIPDVPLLSELLHGVPGVMEHGLFVGLADEAIVAGPDGVVVLTPDAPHL